MRILIAEDDVTSRAMLVALLTRNGHEAVEAADGAEAWKVLQSANAPLLVILDWVMPGLEGLEVVRRVRALSSPQPPYIIMLTSKGEKADIVAGLDAGANDYVCKPFDIGELRARVQVGKRMIETQADLLVKIAELREANSHIRTLRGILPICASCKKIRNDKGYWQQVDEYVRAHTEAEFSHGICPECLNKFKAEYKTDIGDDRK